MTDLEPSSDWRTWSITVPSPASEQSVTSSPLQTSATLYSIFREIATPFFELFFDFFEIFSILPLFRRSLKKSAPACLFRPFVFARSLRPFYPLIRVFLFRPQCPLVRAFLFRFERYFHKLSPLVPPHFCLFCIIRSFMSVPSDLILFHPARRFIVLKQFSAFVSRQMFHLLSIIFRFSRQCAPTRSITQTEDNQSRSSLIEGVEPAARCAGGRQAERRRSGTAQP